MRRKCAWECIIHSVCIANLVPRKAHPRFTTFDNELIVMQEGLIPYGCLADGCPAHAHARTATVNNSKGRRNDCTGRRNYCTCWPVCACLC